MQRALFGILMVTVVMTACTQRTTCPAFQSAYIYDKNELRKKFSYFLEDSTPKIYTASKTRYLIAEPVSYKKKLRQMKTLEMKPINPVVPDSLKPGYDPNLGKDGEDGVVPGAELDQAARSVIDSTYIVDVPVAEEAAPQEDSVYMISRDREVRLLKYNFPDSLKLDSATGRYVPEKPYYAVVNVTFNVEQDNYMWYLKDYLVLPDVRLARNKGAGGDEDEAAEGKSGKKAKKGGFFKNLFKKKKEEPVEEEPELPPPPKNENEDFDFIEDEEQAPATDATTPVETKKKRKGLFGRDRDAKEKSRKTPARDETEEDVTEDPADEIKEDEGVDGF